MKHSYALYTNPSNRLLGDTVQKQMDRGWVLHGSPFVAVVNHETFFCQAMTKTTDKKSK